MSNYVLDACAIIAFLDNEAGANVVRDLLRKSPPQRPNVFVHRLNLLEVYYGVYREAGLDSAVDILGKIRALPIIELPEIAEEVFMEAGKLKATYRLSLADCIVAAEAKILSANIVTCDHHEFEPVLEHEPYRTGWGTRPWGSRWIPIPTLPPE